MDATDEEILTYITNVFTPDKFDVSFGEDTFFIKDITTKNPCVYLVFQNDNTKIYVGYLEKCGNNRGTELLRLIDQLALAIPGIETLGLIDESEVNVGCNIEISLSTLKLLTKGSSWYNSLGYESMAHNANLKHNLQLIERPFIDVFNSVVQKQIKQNKAPKYPTADPTAEDIQKTRLALFPHVNIDLPVKDYISHIYTEAMSDEENCDKKKFLQNLLLFLKPATVYFNWLEKPVIRTTVSGGKLSGRKLSCKRKRSKRRRHATKRRQTTYKHRKQTKRMT